MKNKCIKCGTGILPSWKTCNECDRKKRPKEKPARPPNPYMAKYRDDSETLEELQKRKPAGKSKKQ